ncbi:MAG: 16S rRNA (cytidine(1402)-2'-O)-methyltransferase [Nitrospinae bacterium]|nr:16S rRNA (cytidine(1402)-2'-O)-methyltransferase [Nitrospinota bacterium]
MVATPIGNLEDFSIRAADTLKSADIVACEDTRHASILLNRHGIYAKKLVSYHSHNIERRSAELLRALLDGQNVALISDAGSPGVSDPGAALTRMAAMEGIIVRPIPGPSAFLSALIASGFPTARFVYEGFLPRKKGRKTRLLSWQGEQRTVVFYESPHRLIKTLVEIAELLGDRLVCVTRELTKIHEEVVRGTAAELAAEFSARGQVKGEITVVVAPQNFTWGAVEKEED